MIEKFNKEVLLKDENIVFTNDVSMRELNDVIKAEFIEYTMNLNVNELKNSFYSKKNSGMTFKIVN